MPDPTTDSIEDIARDARRYRRLQILGCAVPDLHSATAPEAQRKALYDVNVSRFSNLDKLIDDDLVACPSRGESRAGHVTLVQPYDGAAEPKRKQTIIRPSAADLGLVLTLEERDTAIWLISKLHDDEREIRLNGTAAGVGNRIHASINFLAALLAKS